jgi:hypothetical protein
MNRWLSGVVFGVVWLCAAAPAQAAGLPVRLLSPARVGLVCMDSANTNVAVDCWLDRHPDVANAMVYQENGFSGPWASWPAAAKTSFHQYFNLMVVFYKLGMPLGFPQPLPTPLPLQGPGVFTWGGSFLTEAEGRTEYLLLVGNNIAAELTEAFPWSIQSYTATQDYELLAMFNTLGDWLGPPTVVTPGYYFAGIDHTAPATPAYTLAFFKKKQLLAADAPHTIANLFMWERNLTHYYLDAGVNPFDMVQLFWGPMAPPISESQLIHGSTYTGPTGPSFGHFTQGCTGTQDFMKVVLQAVNIPVETTFTAFHATPIFPTVDLAMTHGDDPYDRIGVVSPVVGFPTPDPLEYLVTTTQLSNLCDPGWTDPSWCEHKIGLAPAAVGILYGSDYLMNMHCQDLAAGKTHADSSVLNYLLWYFPEMTAADVQTLLEGVGMWTTLDAKVVASGFCQ